MGNNDLVEFLNKALFFEYTDIFLYLKQAGMLKQEEEEISKIFDRLAFMEMRHTDNLAIQIKVLGGIPDWEFDYPDIEGSTEDILIDHLEREQKAIDTYQSIIDIADKEGHDQLKIILQGIKSEEEDHFKKIKDLLSKISKGGRS